MWGVVASVLASAAGPLWKMILNVVGGGLFKDGVWSGLLSGVLTPLVQAAVALLQGLVLLVVDLSKRFEGRVILAIILLTGSVWYVDHTYTIVERGQWASSEKAASERDVLSERIRQLTDQLNGQRATCSASIAAAKREAKEAAKENRPKCAPRRVPRSGDQ
jgi:hypothetical protein